MNEQIHYNGINYYDKTVLLFFFVFLHFVYIIYNRHQTQDPTWIQHQLQSLKVIYIYWHRGAVVMISRKFFFEDLNLSQNHGMKNVIKDSFEVSHQMLFGGGKFIYLV